MGEGSVERHGIPAARARDVHRRRPAVDFVDGWAGARSSRPTASPRGKGVTVADDRGDAIRSIRERSWSGAFGDAGATVVVEEFLEGHGGVGVRVVRRTDSCPWRSRRTQAHRRRRRGAEHGRDGRVLTAPVARPTPTEDGSWTVVAGRVRAMAARRRRVSAAAVRGLMLTPAGPKLLEFNCRFGDPETQVVMPRLRIGPGGAAARCADGRLPM